MRLNRQTTAQKEIKTCRDFVQSLKKSFIFNGEIFFNLEEEGVPTLDECTPFSDIFTIRPIGELDDFQVLKVHLKSGILRACDGEEEGQDNVHLLALAGLQLTEYFKGQDGVNASMSLSETNDNTNYPGIYVYVIPPGMTYRGYLKALSDRKAEEVDSNPAPAARGWTAPRRGARWGSGK